MATFQEELMRNRFATVALELPQKYKVAGNRLHELSKHLAMFDAEREKVGKSTHIDLLRQEATRWAKENCR